MSRSLRFKKNIKINLEGLLFMFVLLGMIFPLSLNLIFVQINTWHIPFIALVFFSVLRAFKRSSYFKRLDQWDLSLIAICLFLLFSTIINPNIEENFRLLQLYIFAAGFGIYVRKNWGITYNLNTLFVFFAAVLFIETFTGIIQQITNTAFGNPARMLGGQVRVELGSVSGYVSRVIGTIGHGNWVATWLLIGIPFVWLIPKYYPKGVYWYLSRILILGAFTTLLFTVSRAAIGLLLGFSLSSWAIVFLTSYYIRKFPDARPTIFYSIILGVSIFLIMANWDIVELMVKAIEYRFSQAGASSSSGASADYRIEMNRGAFLAFLDNPIFGVGYGNMRFLWETYDIYIIKGEMRAHDCYASMLAEGGILALLLFMYIIFYPIYRMMRIFKPIGLHIAMMWALMSYAVLCLVYISPFNYQNLPYFFLIFGMIMGYIDEQKLLAKKDSV